MDTSLPRRDDVRRVAQRHAQITLRGLLVVLVPGAFAAKYVEQVHKSLLRAVAHLDPVYQVFGDIGVMLAVALLVLIVGWLLGWILAKTTVGQRIMQWEKAKFVHRSPMLTKHLGDEGKQKAEPEKPVLPVLMPFEATWQPGIIVEQTDDGWASVFVPDAPSVSEGRVYCVKSESLLRLDVTLEDFRDRLSRSGRGSTGWLRTLAEAQVD